MDQNRPRVVDDRGELVTVGMVLRRTSNYPPYLCAAHGHYTVKEITPRGTVVVEVGGYEGYVKRIPWDVVKACLRVRP
jgi:hypothetical protein